MPLLTAEERLYDSYIEQLSGISKVVQRSADTLPQ